MENTQLLITIECITATPHSKHGWTTRCSDYRCQPYNFLLFKLRSHWTESYKFLQNVQKWLPVKLLKSKLRYSHPFSNASVPNERRSSNCNRVATKILQTPYLNSELDGVNHSNVVDCARGLSLVSTIALSDLVACMCVYYRLSSEVDGLRRVTLSPAELPKRSFLLPSHSGMPHRFWLVLLSLRPAMGEEYCDSVSVCLSVCSDISRTTKFAEFSMHAICGRGSVLLCQRWNTLDFDVNRFFMKLFQTGNIEVVKCCQLYLSASNYLVSFTTGVLENLIQDKEIIQTYFVRWLAVYEYSIMVIDLIWYFFVSQFSVIVYMHCGRCYILLI